MIRSNNSLASDGRISVSITRIARARRLTQRNCRFGKHFGQQQRRVWHSCASRKTPCANSALKKASPTGASERSRECQVAVDTSSSGDNRSREPMLSPSRRSQLAPPGYLELPCTSAAHHDSRTCRFVDLVSSGESSLLATICNHRAVLSSRCQRLLHRESPDHTQWQRD